MADKSKDYDDIVASRQRIYRQPGFVAAMRDIMALQDPEIRARNLLGPDGVRGDHRTDAGACGPATTPPPTSPRAGGSRR